MFDEYEEEDGSDSHDPEIDPELGLSSSHVSSNSISGSTTSIDSDGESSSCNTSTSTTESGVIVNCADCGDGMCV